MRSKAFNRDALLCWYGLFASAGLLAGCAAGPEYVRPALPTVAKYATLPATTESVSAPTGAAQHFSNTAAVRTDWWSLFSSPELNDLIRKAFAASPTVEAANAALAAAQENVYAQKGFFYPTLQANYTPARNKIAGNLGGNSPGVQGDGSVISTTSNASAAEGGAPPFNAPVIYNFHTAQLTVGYTPDVFGANRRQVESAEAQARYQQFQLDATYTTLAANVVAAAIQEALLRKQIDSTREIIDANEKAVELVHRQWKAGYASRLDVSIQESALAQAKQQLPPLRKQFEQTRDLLRTLVGGGPDLALSDTFDLASLQLPEELPLSLPSQLVEQRPDVRAAEEQLRAASAQIGVAAANRLPQFSIDGAVGGAASHFSQMFWSSGQFFNLAANITVPLFDGGTLRHRQRGAEEAYRQSAAQYRATVINAFQNVADTLHAIHSDAQALQAAVEVERTARVSLELIRRQLNRGYVDRLALIGAEQTYRQASLSVAQARAARLGDTVALFQALGGGWDYASEAKSSVGALLKH